MLFCIIHQGTFPAAFRHKRQPIHSYINRTYGDDEYKAFMKADVCETRKHILENFSTHKDDGIFFLVTSELFVPNVYK